MPQLDGTDARRSKSDSETTETRPPGIDVSAPPSGADPEHARHVSCDEPTIERWISSESVRAPSFLMAVAR
jgi:hypothetical protein